MSDDGRIRLLLEQEGPYAYRFEFDGTSLDALHTDELAPLGAGAGAGPNPSAEKSERVLGQFEQVCIVTQSVRDGIEVDVAIVDADGTRFVPGAAG